MRHHTTFRYLFVAMLLLLNFGVTVVMAGTPKEVETLSDPVIKIVKVDGADRIITITGGQSSFSTATTTTYYSIGGMPTTHSTVYTDSIRVSKDCKISAITISSTGLESNIISLKVTVGVVQLNAPVWERTNYDIGKGVSTVKLTSDQSDKTLQPVDTIFYTIDGGDTQRYESPLAVSNGSTLSFYANCKGYNNSPTETVTFDAPCGEATVTEAGWATWVAPSFNVTVPSGVEAYYVTSAAGGHAILAPVTAIPANQPVLLKNAGSFEFPICAEAAALSGNLLRVSDGTQGKGDYVLCNRAVIGFYKWDGDALDTGTVYLPASSVSDAREFIGFMVANATSIGDIMRTEGTKESVDGAAVYDLQGRRIDSFGSKAQPKLYIVNGRKYSGNSR